MSEQTDKQLRKTLFSSLFWLIMRIVVWALLGWLLVIIIGCVMMLWLGYNNGFHYLNNILNGQLHYLGAISHNFSVSWPINFAVICAHFVYKWMFVKTKLIYFIQGVQQSKSANNFFKNYLQLNPIINSSYPVMAAYLKVVVISTELMVVKLVTLFLSLLGIVLIMFVGIVDGLVQRDIRKFSGARETALLYHKAKGIAFSFIAIGFFFYLILPLNIASEFILIPVSVISAYFVMVSIKLFKKKNA